MRLYATITSERASKGQGGNDYLHIDILCETENGREKVAEINLMKYDNEAMLKFQNVVNGVGIGIAKELKRIPLKAKRQKGEKHEGQHEQCNRCMEFVAREP